MRKVSATTVLLLAISLAFLAGCPDNDKGTAAGPASGAVLKQDETLDCCIIIRTFVDTNNNGQLDADADTEVEGIPVGWEGPLGSVLYGDSPVWCANDQAPGHWEVWQGETPDYTLIGAVLNWEVVENFMDPIPIDVPDVCEGYFEVIFLETPGGGEPPEPPVGDCDLNVIKVNDLNGNGVWDPGEPEIAEWPITLTAPDTTVTETETPVCVDDPMLGVWTIDEGFFEGWWQTGVTVNGEPLGDLYMPVEVEFTCDEQFTIVFLNATCEGGGEDLGSICAVKVYDVDGDGPDEGDPPIEGWQFCLTPCDDIVITVDGDGVEPLCAYTDETGTVCWQDLPAGCYQVCEVMPCGDWVATTDECVTVDLEGGENEEVVFANYCFTEIDMHTKGWWQNKHGCAAVTADPTLLEFLNSLEPYMSGTIITRGIDNCTGDRCTNVALPFDSASELGCFLTAPNSQSNKLQLAQQLAAFVLNVVSETGSLDLYFPNLDMTAAEIVEAAINAWETGVDVGYWTTVLDLLNNSEEMEVISPEPCEVSYDCVPDGEDGDRD